MKKPILIASVVILSLLLVQVFNLLTSCSEYGGFMGIVKKCNCYGLEVPHPLDNLYTQMPGGSSTMCVGIQDFFK